MKPIDSNTMPAQAVDQSSWLDRIARKTVLSVFERFDRSPILLRLPEGREILFGKESQDTETAILNIHSKSFFRRILINGEIGFGEAYMEGDWSTPELTHVIAALIDNLEHIPQMSGSHAKALAFHLLGTLNKFAHWTRRNTRNNSRRNISEHYDLSNEFYSLWLDETLTYSSAWFMGDENLKTAQENKYQRLCEKMQLKPGMEVLEIGCGWGGFSIFAARNFGVKMTAITISEAQFEKASARVLEEGLKDSVTVLLSDYRDIEGQFDAIASIEMLEAVGHQYLKDYFAKCHHLLKPAGRVGLQVIVCPDSRYDAMRKSVDWIKKHIFPGGQLPSIKALIDSVNATGDLYLQHLESFGMHYAKTLNIWRDQFNEKRDAVMDLGFDETFFRKWNYYLAYCEAAFASRNINVSQLILSRPNNTDFVLEG
ncbi:class I SAM-dependent methyltransferase [Puniceicoccales bacterium CK1056]|uniref:Class I SAM-dependent methyltransferase n=1 Tax=Oceanipulchritudo coccoides TaxID=2706888 RepID=A0A6B2M580_9BACT|nr:cyclopropane-fatty-acyl-phospholipid synthase family protein [Oceanipulchritudo coccoides]NDV63546.1 class I SAM-dependent methyltransferase [Oceanipulchritudo coccoides]